MPQTMRGRIALLVSVMICLPVIIIAYIVEIQGRDALLIEKSEKLHGIAHQLDDQLGDSFTLTPEEEKSLTREEKLALFHKRTTPLAERVAKIYPGLGAGYYHRGLNAMITYAPNEDYGYTLGVPIGDDHLGREVMARGEPLLAYGSQVRGNIMNAMWPIIRNGEVIGYVWANEFYDSVQMQIRRLDWSVMVVLGSGLLLSFALVLLLSRSFGRDVDTVKNGLKKFEYDLNTLLPELKGEIGEIAGSANVMATSLREARGLNENILNSISDGVITVDNEGRVTMLNPAAQALTGLKPEIVLKNHYRDFFQTEGRRYVSSVEGEMFRSPLMDTLRTGKKYTDMEFEYPGPEQVFHVSATTELIMNSKGERIGAAVFMRNISETKRMEDQIRRAEQLAALGELVAGVAHEVRNPLTAIRGFVQFLDEGATPKERKEYTGIILKEVDSINRVIRQLLSFARPTPQHYQLTRIRDLLKDVLVLVQTRNIAGRISVELDIAESLPDIEVDGELIKQVFLNLLLNAVQSIEDEGRVLIEAEMRDIDDVEIRITDTGCGISRANRERIFLPFFTTKPTGTGLGLSIVQRIIVEHNGEITIDSVEGEGTVVTLRFPVHRREEQA